MCQSIQHKHPKPKHRKLKNEIETQTKKEYSKTKTENKTSNRTCCKYSSLDLQKTMKKQCTVSVFMCQSIQHKHPKTKHRKLKKRNRNSIKKKNTANRKQKTKHRNELVVNIIFWTRRNHWKVLYSHCLQVSEHPTQTLENQTPET